MERTSAKLSANLTHSFNSLYELGLSWAIGDWTLGMNEHAFIHCSLAQNRQVLGIGIGYKLLHLPSYSEASAGNREFHSQTILGTENCIS